MTTDAPNRPFDHSEIDAWRSTFQRVLDALPASLGSKSYEAMTASERDRLKEHRQLRLLTRSANGLTLEGEQDALQHWHHARKHYRHWLTEMQRSGVTCRVLKSFSIAPLYPDGWVRTSGDLDLHLPTDDDLWRAAEVLTAGGWWIMSGALVAADEGPSLVIPFQQRCDACDGLLEIELRGLACFGDPRCMTARRRFPTNDADDGSIQVVALLEEGFQRRFTPRDVFDTWLVTRHWPEGTMRVMGELDLWPEYARMVATATRLGAPPLPTPPDLAARSRATTRHRRRRRAGRFRKRSGWAQLAGATLRRAPDGRLQELASRVVEGLARPASVYAEGFPLFGLQLDRSARPFAVRSDDETVTVDTPVGRLGFTHAPALVVGSDEVDLDH